MKKILSLALALVLVLSMSTVAFAAEGEETTYADMSTVTLTKEYKLTNAGTTSPAETFAFSALTCTNVTDAADSVTADSAPVPTIASVSYSAGEAGGENAKKNITITLPTYTSVGIYTYTFTETDGGTAGVTYRSDAITLVVTVIEQNGKVRVAAVHTEGEGNSKSGEFNNEYSAGSLSVKKTVTGIMGDQEKEFTVKVTFTAPEGDFVREAITYVDGKETKTIDAGKGWTGSKEVEITLKHDETVTFTNIPYGVTYNVVENDYTTEDEGGYDAASYNFDDNNKKIDTASENVTITNNKDGKIDTGINMDSMPYILLLAVACMGLFVFISKKRMMREF
ncbi:putative uncharacterized protein [Firmicutes bacterium CAG:646]|nr:putative uncharacterized protein [Firmicutes bacterium CAG:646]